MKRTLATVIAVCLLGLIPASEASAGVPSTLTGLSGAQIVNVSIKDALATGSCTRTAVENVLGTAVTSTTTSTLRTGRQTGRVKGHTIHVVFVDSVVYAKFDAGFVTSAFGKSIRSIVNKWVAFNSRSKYYATFADGMTLPLLAKILVPAGTLSVLAPTTMNGRSVIGVAGWPYGATSAADGIQTLYVSSSAPYLPVRMEVRSALSGSNKPLVDVSFKNWGARVTITHPTNFVPSYATPIP
jgi:hypothetical protein